jgi:hypothetical protein
VQSTLLEVRSGDWDSSSAYFGGAPVRGAHFGAPMIIEGVLSLGVVGLALGGVLLVIGIVAAALSDPVGALKAGAMILGIGVWIYCFLRFRWVRLAGLTIFAGLMVFAGGMAILDYLGLIK